MTQLDTLRQHFDSGRSLTFLESVELYGVLALSQRVGELKRDGYPIESRMIELPNGKRIAQYYKRHEPKGQLELIA